MAIAVKEAITENRDTMNYNDEEDIIHPTDLSVSYDGTWMKRGHTSLYGVSTIINVATGKVLDVQVMSKYCSVCATRTPYSDKKMEEEWQKQHEISCYKNYTGTSGGMEAAGMTRIFNRSVEKYGIRYVKYLGGGASSAHKAVCEARPYGPDCPIEKLECVGHIQKRMGSRLRKLLADNKGKKLQDGKAIGGKGRLTKKEIDTLQVYYGKHIRNNLQNVEDMRRSIWATYFHHLSTDANPQHALCSESWCQYKQSVRDKKTYNHKHSLPESVMLAMKPIFQALTKPELLRKYLHGKTQNTNESLNAMIWTRCPKTTFCSSTVVSLATYDSVLIYNDGNVGRM